MILLLIEYYTSAVCGYEFYLLVFSSTSHSFAELIVLRYQVEHSTIKFVSYSHICHELYRCVPL